MNREIFGAMNIPYTAQFMRMCENQGRRLRAGLALSRREFSKALTMPTSTIGTNG